MNATRRGGPERDEAAGPAARPSDSSQGRASTVPRPFKAARREMVLGMGLFTPLAATFLERVTFDDREDQGGEPVLAAGEFRDHLVQGALVVVFEAPAEGVGQQLLGQAPPELVRLAEQGLAEFGRAVEGFP